MPHSSMLTVAAASHRARPASMATVFANGPAALVAVVGIALELLCAWQRPGHALWTGGWGALQAATLIAAFWFTISWCAVFIARASHRWRVSRQLLAITALTAAIVAYIASWSVFLQTGRFANWETVRFTVANLAMLVDFLRAADAVQFIWLALVVGTLLIGLPLLANRLSRPAASAWTPEMLQLRIGGCLVLLGLLWFSQCRVNADLSMSRLMVRTDAFRNCLNPVVTIACSAVDAWQAEPIAACLEPAELTPLIATPLASASPMEKRRAVILIAIESLRADVVHARHQGHEIMPHLNRLAEQGLEFSRAYAQSTHSDYADVCLASSLYPLRTRNHHYYRADDPWPKTMLYDLLKRQGYDTAIISSQNEAWGGMDQFLQTPRLDLFYHPQNSAAPTLHTERDPGFHREVAAGTLVAGKFPDAHTTGVALKWIEARQSRPFFLAMNLQSSHFPYLIPEDAPRLFRPCELTSDIKFSNYTPEQAPTVRNAYYNGLAECDRQIGRLIQQLAEWQLLDDVIIVVTGENGEAFCEAGAIGHAGNPVEPVIHVAAVINAPGLIEPGVNDYPLEHVDLAPTLCGLLHIEASPNFQGIDVLAADRPAAEERHTFVHVLSPIAQGDAVIRGGRWKFVATLDRPQGALFDLAVDPGESNDLSVSDPVRATQLRTVLRTWRERQLAYYHFPQYYGKYFPPQPPGR